MPAIFNERTQAGSRHVARGKAVLSMSQRGPSRRRCFNLVLQRGRQMSLLGSFSLFNKWLLVTCRNRVKYNFATDYLGRPRSAFRPSESCPAVPPRLSHTPSRSPSATCRGQSIISLMHSVLPSSPWHFLFFHSNAGLSTRLFNSKTYFPEHSFPLSI